MEEQKPKQPLQSDDSQKSAPSLKDAQISSLGSKSTLQKIILVVSIVLVVAVVGASITYIFLPKSAQDTVKKTVEDVYKPATAIASGFATYEEIPVQVDPKIPAYSVNSDLSNVINADMLYLSDSAKDLLVNNAFVVTPSYHNEFFPLYENNRYRYMPSFVTTDSMLHNYHLMFDFLLKQLEEQKLSGELKELNFRMLDQALRQYNSLVGTPWENAAKRNVGFFAVGSKLLDPNITIPDAVADEVDRELKLIDDHKGIEESPVMNIGGEDGATADTPQGELSLDALKEDYSQYVPRGHYDRTEQLKAYFKAMMWYGRLTFRLKNIDEVKSAILITAALNTDDNREIWDKIYEPINFFVGKSDDITYYQFNDLLKENYSSEGITLSALIDENKLNSSVAATKDLAPPQINSIPIFEASQQSDREKEIKGFRFMGQRFTIDAAIFQRLLYREVGDKTTTCADFKPEKTGCLSGARCLPKSLDIPATLGSSEAESLLDAMGETKYACYNENMSKMATYVSGLDTDIWTQNLYWGWLYQLRPLLTPKGEGYPSFMRNTAWIRKDLNTFLGSWTELKHDTILYAKQVYAELGGGPPEEKDDRGYVEPNPLLYARLTSLLKMTAEGLSERGLLTDSMKDNLDKMEELAMAFKIISEKELNNESLTDEEYELIRSYGGQLEHFWLEVNKDEPAFKESSGQRDYLNENPAALVADVATDPNGFVLEEGTGKIFEIYVVVPIDGQLRVAKGGVYSYYEFSWPMSDRLTDKKWRELLGTDNAPALPSWTEVFIAE